MRPARSSAVRGFVVERERVEIDDRRRSRAWIEATRVGETVSVVRPRKSILSMPAFSSAFMSYCVTTTVSSSRSSPLARPQRRWPAPWRRREDRDVVVERARAR